MTSVLSTATLLSEMAATREDRLNVPNTMFITPALSQVGLTESQAADLETSYAVKEFQLQQCLVVT